jgi:beta-glucosidase
VAGIGAFEFAVDGAALFNGMLRPESEEVVTAFVDPPEHRVVVDLAADVPIEVSVTRTVPDDSGISRTLLSRMISFRIGHADPIPDVDTGIEQAVEAAAAADVAIVAVATTEAVESEGFDRTSLRLPGRQDELVARVAAANPNTVAVVSAGSPVEMPWAAEVPAILLTWFGGQELGAALADVLTGTHEPGGRLPTTWPKTLADAPVSNVDPSGGELRYDEGIFIGYRAWRRGETEPAFWFGHGLGYTDWTYGEASFEADGADERLGGVSVTVTNSGDRGGREVVQVYLASESDEDDRPERWLAGFTSVSAAAAESATATVSIPRRAVQVWDPRSHSWHTRAGRYTLQIGHSVADIRVSVPITVA